jgi:hypothetical protein
VVDEPGTSLQNPFRPSFGVSPPVLAGRTALIEHFRRALEAGPGYPDRATIYLGARGTGKTVMLNTVEDEAHEHGWRVISETASPGLAARVAGSHLPTLFRELDPKADSTTFTGFSTPFGGLSWEGAERHSVAPELRSQLAAVTDLLGEGGSGLLLTVDELAAGSVEDLREIVVTVQHMFREGREVAIVLAGLPSGVDGVLAADGLTFLQRAARYELGPVALGDVSSTLQETAELGGRRFEVGALLEATHATRGYPFMVQLVGFHAWEQARAAAVIDTEHVEVAIALAASSLGQLVYEPVVRRLGGASKDFLTAMAQDDGPTYVAELAKRLGRSKQHVNTYRRRLIEERLIEPAGRGLVTLSGPFLRQWVRENQPLRPGH